MLISKEMKAQMNAQIGNELLASNQYVAIAAYFDQQGLPTLAKHFYRQASEERAHAMRFVRFLVDADAPLAIPAVPAPKASFKSAEEAVKTSYDNEIRVTKQINALMQLAIRENDYLSKSELEWFIREQREEVASMDTLLRMVRRAGESGLLFVENYLLQGGAAASEAAPQEGEGD